MKKILFLFFSIQLLSVILYSCCKDENFVYDYDSISFYHINKNFQRNLDSIPYSQSQVILSPTIKYANSPSFSFPLISSAIADGTICKSKNNYLIRDSVTSVSVVNLADNNKDITTELVHSLVEYPRMSIDQYLKKNYKSSGGFGFYFSPPYTESKQYEIVIKINFKSGKTLTDTTAKFLLY